MQFGVVMSDSCTDLAAVTPPKVLIIEDEDGVGRTLVTALERSGMRTAWATTGAEALRLKTSFQPDVVLVDLALPDASGISLVKHLAQMGDCGVIIVSGAGEESDRIVGLEIGADDYIAKPPHLRELLARIRAVHRRVQARATQKDTEVEKPGGKASVQVGHIRIDLDGRSVRRANGERIALTGAEFAALETMLNAHGEPVSRDKISEVALRRRWRPEDRSVDQLIFNLRHKIATGDGESLIHSIRGAGYLLAARAPEAAAQPTH